MIEPVALLDAMLHAALAAVQPQRCLPAHLPAPPRGRCVVVGAGKAAAAMARVVEAHWAGPPERLGGIVVTRAGQEVRCARIEVLAAPHPLPDATAVFATERVLAAVRGLSADDLVLALFSGGGSALLTLPAEGVSLAEKRALSAELLRCGASIREINCVRKHLSAIKGGRLALTAVPAPVLTLAISDVPGDDPATIASGPTVGDASTCEEALAVLDRYRIACPATLRAGLASGRWETPKPDDARFARCTTKIVASGLTALQAASEVARAARLTPIILGDAIEGEAREVARAFAGIALGCQRQGVPAPPPCVILSGGETTVHVRGQGQGGRNSEFALALALALDGAPGIHALACDTDGIDGNSDAAGARIAPDTLARAAALGLDARAALEDNDAAGFFAKLGDLLRTGPTDTNVGDWRAIVVMPA